jgi:anti-anti-sigma factor
VEDSGNTTVVRFSGGTLALHEDNAQALASLLDQVCEQARGRKLVLDFSNVEFLSSTALGDLVRLHKRMQSTGGSLSILDLPDHLYGVFEVTRLTTLFDVRRASPTGWRRQLCPVVLVADDEEYVRLVLARGLRQDGFEVVLAASGRQAVELFRHDRHGIAVVLLDVRMPGLSGPETFAQLRQISPEVTCCFMTGDAGAYTEEALLDMGAVQVFRKPFHLSEVAKALRRLVAGARSN